MSHYPVKMSHYPAIAHLAYARATEKSPVAHYPRLAHFM